MTNPNPNKNLELAFWHSSRFVINSSTGVRNKSGTMPKCQFQILLRVRVSHKAFMTPESSLAKAFAAVLALLAGAMPVHHFFAGHLPSPWCLK